MPKSSGVKCIYRVTSQHNTLIRVGADDMQGRLKDNDWVVALSPGTYLLLTVDGRLVTGRPDYPRFHGKSLGTPLRWALTPRELLYLEAGETIEAPMDLDRLLEDEIIPGRFPRHSRQTTGTQKDPDNFAEDA